MSSGRYINNTGIKVYRKPLVEEAQKIQRAEIQDQSYALMRYRELIAARKEREKLHPREPEVYHHNICKKS
jgi:hypothetical protein